MFFLSFVVSIFGIVYIRGSSAECDDDADKKIIFDCYSTHLNQYNYSAQIYEYVFTVLQFSSVEGKNSCLAFEALGKCIGEERFNTCVRTESLAKILGKSWDEARDLLYIYRRMQIYCFYLPELIRVGSPSSTSCYEIASINTCAAEQLSHKKSNSSNNCGAYEPYLDCSIKYIGGACSEPYARMHCDFMNLIVSTYHSYCGLKSFNCSKFNFTEESRIGAEERHQFLMAFGYFGMLYGLYLGIATHYSRYIYASVFIVILCSIFKKKNSPLKTSFFALFLLIPLYDTVFVVFYILRNIIQMDSIYPTISVYLEESYATMMPLVLLFMSINRFTAINFPLRHGSIWNICATVSSITISIFLTMLISFIHNLVQGSMNISLIECQNKNNSLYCYMRNSIFDLYEFSKNFQWFRCIFSFSLCGLCLLLLIASAIRFEFCVKNKSEILKTAEKRLFLITCIEVALTIFYTFFNNATNFVFNVQYWHISLHVKPVVFVHHFVSIVLFFVFSKAIRNAYIQFFFLDVLYKKVFTIYPFSKVKKRNERIVAIPCINK